MQQSAGAIAAGQDETAQGRELAFEPIDPVFETLDVHIGDGHFRDAIGDLLGRVGQSRADGEQVLLKLFEHRCHIARQLALRAHGAETGVELVDIAVRGDAGIGFRHALTSKQRRPAGIAGARVNLHGRQYT